MLNLNCFQFRVVNFVETHVIPDKKDVNVLKNDLKKGFIVVDRRIIN